MFFFFSLFSCRFGSAQLQQLKPLMFKRMLSKATVETWVRFALLGCFQVLWFYGEFWFFFFFLKFWNLFFNFFLGDCKAPEWKKLSSKELGLSNSLISMPTKKVLNGLKKNGIVLGHNELFCICGFSLFCWR
jgi:hypothetical protein